MGTKGQIAFSNAERTWEESFDLLDILAKLLQQSGYKIEQINGWLQIESNYYVRPEIVEFQPLEPSGLRTVTIIAVSNKDYCPEGIFEYQHATGDNTTESLANGFSGLIEHDLPAILEVGENERGDCNLIEMEFPEPNSRTRCAVLGPPTHVVSSDVEYSEEHPFCPCCLFTNSYEAFMEHIEEEEYFALRLLVVREETGEVSADCRVNGLDWELGKEHLVKYGEAWLDRGFEMRKQYVVIFSKTGKEDA